MTVFVIVHRPIRTYWSTAQALPTYDPDWRTAVLLAYFPPAFYCDQVVDNVTECHDDVTDDS